MRKHAGTLSVCTRCRPQGQAIPDRMRPGYRLAEAIHARFAESDAARRGIALRGVRCMSQCKRSCTIALSGPGKYTLLFGDLDPSTDAEAILQLAAQYAEQPDGYVERNRRPVSLRAGILGRIPPLDITGEAIDPDFSIQSPSALQRETQ